MPQGANISELSQEYGISRKTAHKWKARYLEQGRERLRELSRKSRRAPGALDEGTVGAMIRLENAHPPGGPRKIRELC